MTGKVLLGALGGTFDHFHAGHEHFLLFAAKYCEKLLIGVTSQSMVSEKLFYSSLQPLQIRQQSVRNFCEQKGIEAEVIELTDHYGPTLGQKPVDCLIVTQLTQQGGAVLNQERVRKGLKPLNVHVCKMVHDAHGQILNSTNIRAGKVDRDGKYYLDVLNDGVTLTTQQRKQLSSGWGELLTTPPGSKHIFLVGDQVLDTFLQKQWRFSAAFFDCKSGRKTHRPTHVIRSDVVVANPPGQITSALVTQVALTVEHQAPHPLLVFVNGEEDLAVVPLVLAAPLGSVVCFGQPAVGMMSLEVSEEIKQQVRDVFQADRTDENSTAQNS